MRSARSRMYVNREQVDLATSQSASSSRTSTGTNSKSYDFGTAAYFRQRLQWMALFVFILGTLSNLGRYALSVLNDSPVGWDIPYFSLVIFSLILYIALRAVAPSLKALKGIAIAYQLYLSFGLASLEFLEVRSGVPLGIGVSKVCIVSLIFPLFLHGSVRRNLLLAFLGTSMIPLTYHLAVLDGMAHLPVDMLSIYFFVNFLISVTSVIPTTVINRFERTLDRARDLGAYVFEENSLIGKGGMGEVWKAKHSMLLRPAAIKIFKRGVSHSEDPIERKVAARRFKREAQAIARLKSPHTVDIYDIGTCKNNYAYYYAMEFLEGLDLKELVTRYGPIPVSRMIYLIKQVCHSLSNAHENQLVHRDVKPANVMICHYGSDYDFIKVLDFGLVKLLAQDGVDRTQITQTNVSTGTPAFIAPEMAMGNAVDHRADIYSLGCLMYWLLTGDLVFKADNSIQMAVKHVQEEPAKVSARSEFSIPSELDSLVASCLAKSPEDRPDSVGEIYDRLKTIEQKLMTSADSSMNVWGKQAAKKWWLRHKPTSHQSYLAEDQGQKTLTKPELELELELDLEARIEAQQAQ